GNARHGDWDQRQAVRDVREAQPLSWQARRGRRGSSRGPTAGRRRPAREHQAHRGPDEKLCCYHEGRENLQEHRKVMGNGILKKQTLIALERETTSRGSP